MNFFLKNYFFFFCLQIIVIILKISFLFYIAINLFGIFMQLSHKILILWISFFFGFCMLWNLKYVIRNAILYFFFVHPKSNFRWRFVRWLATSTRTPFVLELRFTALTLFWIRKIGGFRGIVTHDSTSIDVTCNFNRWLFDCNTSVRIFAYLRDSFSNKMQVFDWHHHQMCIIFYTNRLLLFFIRFIFERMTQPRKLQYYFSKSNNLKTSKRFNHHKKWTHSKKILTHWQSEWINSIFLEQEWFVIWKKHILKWEKQRLLDKMDGWIENIVEKIKTIVNLKTNMAHDFQHNFYIFHILRLINTFELIYKSIFWIVAWSWRLLYYLLDCWFFSRWLTKSLNFKYSALLASSSCSRTKVWVTFCNFESVSLSSFLTLLVW